MFPSDNSEAPLIAELTPINNSGVAVAKDISKKATVNCLKPKNSERRERDLTSQLPEKTNSKQETKNVTT